ncbi:MAG: GatB/YqeY domain-containing protein [Candidatus Omnitrophica bacterium]|nr:GatB/YqeY domain-containing protein [Candidatus Omnitrophota bacterium]
MSLEKKIDQDYIQAMKARDTVRSSALSYLRAMVKQVKVDQRLEALDDAGVAAVLKKQIKQRQDSIEQFEKGGRMDLAAKEKAEVELMKSYLPAEMAAEEIKAAIDQAITEAGATSMKDMGNVMKVVRDKVSGRADGKLVSELVKERLAAL